MSDLISRADAIEAVCKGCHWWSGQCDNDKAFRCDEVCRIEALPSADAVDCTDFIEWLVEEVLDEEMWELNAVANGEIICRKLVKLGVLEVTEEPSYYIRPSADAEPKWNCTANFVAEQLDRLRKMTDEEKWEFFRKFFGMGDAVQGEWIWRTDIPIGDGRTSAGYICSNCGEDYWHGNVFNYCPSCGARMKGGDDE